MMNESQKADSKVLNVSVRAWIALLLTVTVCWMSLLGLTVTEPLYSLSIAAVSFYLGKQSMQKPTLPTP